MCINKYGYILKPYHWIKNGRERKQDLYPKLYKSYIKQLILMNFFFNLASSVKSPWRGWSGGIFYFLL